MKALTLSVLLSIVPASGAAAPAPAVGSRIERPALRERHKQGVELLTAAQLADDLEATALNLRDLAYFRYRAWNGDLPEREKLWAGERMREEARQQGLLDRFAAAGSPAPASADAWYMPFPNDAEGKEWEAARESANEGLALARRLRSEAAERVLARARGELEGYSARSETGGQ